MANLKNQLKTEQGLNFDPARAAICLTEQLEILADTLYVKVALDLGLSVHYLNQEIVKNCNNNNNDDDDNNNNKKNKTKLYS